MSTPVPPLVPTSAMPLATDSDAAFDAKAFPALASLNPFGVSLEAIGAATATNADAALAAALGGDLPAITGQALKLLRVNAGETAAEFIDPATVVLAEVPELSQVQVENPASTVFGQVSGQRLAQAAAANVPDVLLTGLERLDAGDEIRSRVDTAGSAAFTDLIFVHSVGIIQFGTLRCRIEKTSGTGVVFVDRVRNGSATTLGSSSATAVLTVDASVIPGDLVRIRAGNGSGSVSYRNARFSTDGQDLWPGNGVRLEGNRSV